VKDGTGRRAWPALLLAAGLMALGAVFIIWPRLGAAIFGLPAPDGPAVAWLAVVGVRDLVFGSYVIGLALLASRHALGLVLALTALIPVSDIFILLAVTGLASPMQLLLHLASAAAVAATATWTLRG
jgi:hypothetical protein